MKKYLLRLSLLFGFLLFIAPVSSATPEYARQTGLPCGKCHIESGGGGPLTEAGKRFLSGLKMKGLYKTPTSLGKIVGVLVGYIHLLTAIVWFGAILYVHILLKPSYVAKGLPKGEILLGWVSIIVMAATGALLTAARMPSWSAFYSTRFGILLCIKIFFFLVMTTTAAVVTFYIGPKMKERMKNRSAGRAEQEHGFSAEELRAFDGKEGRPAYVAYKGSVYDVTGSRLWKGGSHLRKHSAGGDLTESLRTAPHGEEKLLSMERIGKVQSAAIEPGAFHERLFYLFAYMNLAIVFMIVFVVALMRWG